MTPTINASRNLRSLYEAAEVLVDAMSSRLAPPTGLERFVFCLAHISNRDIFDHIIEEGGEVIVPGIAFLISDYERILKIGVEFADNEQAVMLAADDVALAIGLPKKVIN